MKKKPESKEKKTGIEKEREIDKKKERKKERKKKRKRVRLTDSQVELGRGVAVYSA